MCFKNTLYNFDYKLPTLYSIHYLSQGTCLPYSIITRFKLQNIDLPSTTMERIEALIYLVAEDFQLEDMLKKVGYKSFLACVFLFHVRILETDQRDDYSDLELRLLLDTFEKFMRRDIHTRYQYLTRMASIIYKVDEITTLNDIAEAVSEFELEEEFNKVRAASFN